MAFIIVLRQMLRMIELQNKPRYFLSKTFLIGKRTYHPTLHNRVVEKSINIYYFLLLKEMFSFIPPSQFAKLYYSVVSSVLNMKDFISNNICKFIE
jgi:hypothetical protein